jgi:hypothetical protein
MKRVLIAVLGLATSASAVTPSRTVEPNLYFEPNQGQSGGEVQFLSRGMGGTAYLSGHEMTFRLGRSVVQMRLEGALPSSGEALAPQAGVSSYFAGKDRAHWRSGVRHYGQVRFGGVYRGIDMVYYGTGSKLEYDFVVAPGADPRQIQLAYSGLQSMEISDTGDLVLRTSSGDIRQHRPRVYQEIAGKRREIGARYGIAADGAVRFDVDEYAKDRPLIIDPVLEYGTYFGNADQDYFRAMAVDGSGNVYLAGTFSLAGDAVPPNPGYSVPQSKGEATLMKFSPATNTVLYIVHLGDGFYDTATSVAVDEDGNAYLTGYTSSNRFPTVNAYQSATTVSDNRWTGFVSKISPDGKSLIYSTYLGGSVGEGCFSIALAPDRSVYVAGGTNSKDFPLVNPVQTTFGGPIILGAAKIQSEMAFVSKLSADGSNLLYSTIYGGTGANEALRVKLDRSGSLYLVGFTTATDFPLVNPIQSSLGVIPGGQNRANQAAFAVKLAPDGQSAIYSTYLGGDSVTLPNSAAVDATGNLYIAGTTLASDFPMVNALQAEKKSAWAGFVSKINARGTALIYSTYLGGSKQGDAIDDIVVDAAGYLYGSGQVSSADFPLLGAGATIAGTSDAIVFRLSPSGRTAVWVTAFGGSRSDAAYSLVLDSAGAVYAAGTTDSDDFPTLNPYQATRSGFADLFLVKLPATAPAITLDPSTIEIMTSAASGTVTRQIGVACDQCTVESVALDGGTWLSGGAAAGELSIAVDPAKLSPGTYTGVVRLIPPDGTQSGDVIVRLRVVAN